MPFDMSMRVVLGVLIVLVMAVLLAPAMAASGGWRTLAIWYASRAAQRPPPDAEQYRFVTLKTSGGLMGTAAYSSCAMIGVGSTGISMSLWGPFRLYHPPLFIPWDAVQRCRLIEMPGGELVQFAVKDAGTVTVRGAAGAAILRHATRHGITEGSPSAWW